MNKKAPAATEPANHIAVFQETTIRRVWLVLGALTDKWKARGSGVLPYERMVFFMAKCYDQP
ncbi:MAG: hypothetical protein RJB34_204 [Pseudomonadota bacterium]|jgi:hypothetical protein